VTAVVNNQLTADLAATSDFQAAPCMGCGVCTAVCPVGIDLLPRTMFRYALLGLEDKLGENIQALYSCLLCRLCEANCPADVPIAENIRLLRRYVNQRVFDL
jgi:heterodisulfide reductase subunit C